MVDLQGRFQSGSHAVVDSKGKLTVECDGGGARQAPAGADQARRR